jgi:hypothetical protein
VGIDCIGGMELIGEVVLQGRVDAGSEKPEQSDEDDWINGAMLDQPLYIAEETAPLACGFS